MAIASLPPACARPRPTLAPHHKRPSTAPSSPLPRHHKEDLRDLAHGIEESDAGICTRYLIEHDDRFGLQPSGEVRLHDVERCMDRNGVFADPAIRTWHSRLRRARRTIAAMQRAGEQHHVAVLHIAFGPEEPSTREWPRAVRDFYGAELVGLARYTDATEERRKRLVRACTVDQRARAMSLPLAELRVVVQISERRAREAYYDRIISSGDALRDALSAAQIGERPAFLSESRRDAESMLAVACARYHAAWLAALGS